MSDKDTKKEIGVKGSFKTKTLKELGPNLPLGIKTESGVFEKTIELKRWTMKQEKELGAIREDNPQAKMGQYVSMVLAHMCTRLGPYNFDGMDNVKKLLKISQMHSGDVFYAYCWLRYKSLGKDLGLDLTCGRCDQEFVWNADMETLEVNCSDTLEAFLWKHEFSDPFEIRGNMCNGFVFQPSRWNTYETMNDADFGGIGVIKEKMILGSFHNLVDSGEPIALAESEIEDLGKLDLETCVRGIEDERLGPDMSVSVKHSCRYEFIHPIRWGFDDFFGVSSR